MKTDPIIGVTLAVPPTWDWIPAKGMAGVEDPFLEINQSDSCAIRVFSDAVPVNQKELSKGMLRNGLAIAKTSEVAVDTTVAGYPAFDGIAKLDTWRQRNVTVLVPGRRLYTFAFHCFSRPVGGAVRAASDVSRDRYDEVVDVFEGILGSFTPSGDSATSQEIAARQMQPGYVLDHVLVPEEWAGQSAIIAISSMEAECQDSFGRYFSLDELIKAAARSKPTSRWRCRRRLSKWAMWFASLCSRAMTPR